MICNVLGGAWFQNMYWLRFGYLITETAYNNGELLTSGVQWFRKGEMTKRRINKLRAFLCLLPWWQSYFKKNHINGASTRKICFPFFLPEHWRVWGITERENIITFHSLPRVQVTFFPCHYKAKLFVFGRGENVVPSNAMLLNFLWGMGKAPNNKRFVFSYLFRIFLPLLPFAKWKPWAQL